MSPDQVLVDVLVDAMRGTLSEEAKSEFKVAVRFYDCERLLTSLREAGKVIGRRAVSGTVDEALNCGDGSYQP